MATAAGGGDASGKYTSGREWRREKEEDYEEKAHSCENEAAMIW